MALKVTAVICTYNRYDLLPKAIDSLIHQSLSSKQYEILVIDNSPDAKSGTGMEMSEKYRDTLNLKYIFEGSPGLSNARNVAMHLAAGEIITYIDDDAIASTGLLESIMNAFETFDDVGVVGGRILPIWEVEKPSWLDERLQGHVSVVDWGGVVRLAEEGEWFAGANISFDKRLLEQSGGFSTNLGRIGGGNVLLSNEEIEVLNYIKSLGFNAVYAPEASVHHLVDRERLTRDWFRRRVAWQATSDFLMDSETVSGNLQDKEDQLKQFIASREPLMRNVQALYQPLSNPNDFIWQLSAIYAFTVLALSGFNGLESENDNA